MASTGTYGTALQLTLGLMALAIILSACSTSPPVDTLNNNTTDTNATAAGNSNNGMLVRVTYAGGFTPREFATTVITVKADGTATYETRGWDEQNVESVSSSATMQLSTDELAQLRSIVDAIGPLAPSYGEDWRDRVADAGQAKIEFSDKETVVDPNVGEAYPASLVPLQQWVGTTWERLYAQVDYQCSAPMLSECVGDYNPVCADDKTYENPCRACEIAQTYRTGACAAPSGKKLAIDCTEPREPACTKEYTPVCGQLILNTGDVRMETYGNKCEACAAMKVVSYTEGACEGDQIVR